MDIFDEIYFESLDSKQPLSPPTPVISSLHAANITTASSHKFVQPTGVRAAADSPASSLAASAPSFATSSAVTPHRFAELHTLSQNLRLDSEIVSQARSLQFIIIIVPVLDSFAAHFRGNAVGHCLWYPAMSTFTLAGSGVLTHYAAAKSWCIQNMYDAVPIETLEVWKSPKVDAGSCDATLQHAHSFVTISSDSEDSGTDNCRFASTDFSNQRIEERNSRAKVVILDGDSSCESISATTPCPYHCPYQPHLIKCCSNNPLVPGDLLLKAIHEDHAPESEHLDAAASAQAPPDSTAATASPDDSFVYAQRPHQDEPPDSSSVDEEILSCLMPFCETYGRVLRLDCGHTFCTSCLESQRLAKPKKKRSHHRPNKNRSKAMRAKAHVRMKCALCVRPFKMSLLELSAQPSSAVPRVSTAVGLPVEGGGRQVARPPEAQAASVHSSCAYNSAASWNRWDLCWAKLVREQLCVRSCDRNSQNLFTC